MGREGSQAQWLTSWRVEVGGRRIEANPRAASFTYKIPNQPELVLPGELASKQKGLGRWVN